MKPLLKLSGEEAHTSAFRNIFLEGLSINLAAELSNLSFSGQKILSQQGIFDNLKQQVDKVSFVKIPFPDDDTCIFVLTDVKQEDKEFHLKVSKAVSASLNSTGKREYKTGEPALGNLTKEALDDFGNPKFIWVEFVKDENANFVFCIPMFLLENALSKATKNPSQDISKAYKDSAYDVATTSNKYTVLVVEDVAKIRTIQKHFLESEGFNVVEAGDLRTARMRLAGDKIDLVLLDVRLPDGDGFELCEEIKKNEKTSKLPVIFCTAQGTKEDIMTSIKVKADSYVVKPFTKQQLIEKIRAILK
ncbi:MAG: response regulator [Planctomycetes bacterium]|nr:response regulator [Planctomycetota bacterium]